MKFRKSLICTQKIFKSRLHSKNINLDFIQNHRFKLKLYAATNCIAESAVSGVKHQMNLHKKLSFQENSELMIFKRNHAINRLIEDDQEFMQKVAHDIFNGTSLNKQCRAIKTDRDNLKIKAFQDLVQDSMIIETENKKKEENKEKKKKELVPIKYHDDYTKFKLYYDNLLNNKSKSNYLRKVLQKLKADGFTKSYRVKTRGKYDDDLMITQIKKLCTNNGLWPEIEAMDIDNNHNQRLQIQQSQEPTQQPQRRRSSRIRARNQINHNQSTQSHQIQENSIKNHGFFNRNNH